MTVLNRTQRNMSRPPLISADEPPDEPADERIFTDVAPAGHTHMCTAKVGDDWCDQRA